MNPLEHIIGINEAADLWGLSAGTIKNYCAEGRVKAVKIDNRWILNKDQPSPRTTRASKELARKLKSRG